MIDTHFLFLFLFLSLRADNRCVFSRGPNIRTKPPGEIYPIKHSSRDSVYLPHLVIAFVFFFRIFISGIEYYIPQTLDLGSPIPAPLLRPKFPLGLFFSLSHHFDHRENVNQPGRSCAKAVQPDIESLKTPKRVKRQGTVHRPRVWISIPLASKRKGTKMPAGIFGGTGSKC